jgi:hypothetical protein
MMVDVPNCMPQGREVRRPRKAKLVSSSVVDGFRAVHSIASQADSSQIAGMSRVTAVPPPLHGYTA